MHLPNNIILKALLRSVLDRDTADDQNAWVDRPAFVYYREAYSGGLSVFLRITDDTKEHMPCPKAQCLSILGDIGVREVRVIICLLRECAEQGGKIVVPAPMFRAILRRGDIKSIVERACVLLRHIGVVLTPTESLELSIEGRDRAYEDKGESTRLFSQVRVAGVGRNVSVALDVNMELIQESSGKKTGSIGHFSIGQHCLTMTNMDYDVAAFYIWCASLGLKKIRPFDLYKRVYGLERIMGVCLRQDASWKMFCHFRRMCAYTIACGGHVAPVLKYNPEWYLTPYTLSFCS